MIRRTLAAVMILALAACGSGGGSDPGGGQNPPPAMNTASVNGYAFGANRNQVTAQTPLANANARAFTLPRGANPIVTTVTDGLGRFAFSTVTNNALPPNTTLLIEVRSATRVVSGIVTTGGSGEVQSKNLNEATHLAALAVQAEGAASVTAARLDLLEQAARQAIDEALQTNPGANFSALEEQDLAAQVAAVAATKVDDGAITANLPPRITGVTVTPTQYSQTGGPVDISLQATDPESDPLTVVALIQPPGAAVAEVLTLTLAGGLWRGSFSVGANSTSISQITELALIADDGINPPTPQAVRSVTVLPPGQITLDILAETLFDEPASRAEAERLLDRFDVRVVRGGGRSRQVNPNQSIRGAHVVVNDQPSINGDTANDGLLLLDVPLSLLDDGKLAVTCSLPGRVPYQQFLLLPQEIGLRNGDRIEIDLVLATAAQWQTTANEIGLGGTLDFQQVPLLGFFNVLPGTSLGAAQPQSVLYRLIAETSRPDDGDYLVTNLAPGNVTATGRFADPDNAASSPPFGPVALDLPAGHVSAVSALLPPG